MFIIIFFIFKFYQCFVKYDILSRSIKVSFRVSLMNSLKNGIFNFQKLNLILKIKKTYRVVDVNEFA